jgi:hypothetical protein
LLGEGFKDGAAVVGCLSTVANSFASTNQSIHHQSIGGSERCGACGVASTNQLALRNSGVVSLGSLHQEGVNWKEIEGDWK